MIVATCISDLNHIGYRKALVPSCEHFDIHLETIVHEGAWNSHRLKDDHILNFLKRLPHNEIVLFTDAYDAVFLTGEVEILSKFNQKQVPVLFSAEVNCFPYVSLSHLHPPCQSKFRYLNSGGFVGRVGDILALFGQIGTMESKMKLPADPTFGWSNQYRWMKMYLYSRELIGLDTHCEIFQTLGSDLAVYDQLKLLQTETERIELKTREINRVLEDYAIADRMFNKLTGTQPCHLHFISLLMKNHMFSDELYPCLPWRRHSEANLTIL